MKRQPLNTKPAKITDLHTVYFVQVRDKGDHRNIRIKVGETKDFDKRLAEHRKSGLGANYEVKPLCVIKGDPVAEKHIKSYFLSSCWPGETEVFKPTEQLIDYIRWLRNLDYVWVLDDGRLEKLPNGRVRRAQLHNSWRDIPRRDYSDWSPDQYRRIPAPSGLLGLNGPLNLPPRIITADDYYTNEKIIECAHNLFGTIDLDPASHAQANRVVQATTIFTKNDDGLQKDWFGRVWCNPPFSNWKQWAPKIVSEWQSGRVEGMCVHAATRTLSAGRFSCILKNAIAVCFIKGRRPLWGSIAKSSLNDGHVVFYFGERLPEFKKAFGVLGSIYKSLT